MNIVAQIFGALALVFISISYQKNKKGFLLSQIFANLFYAIQYLLLNAFSAFFMNIISMIRCLIFFEDEKKNKTTHTLIFLSIIVIIIIIGIFTYQGPISSIPIFVAVFYTYASWQRNIKVTCAIGMIAAVLWIYYNIQVRAYVAIVGSIIELVSSTAGFKKKNHN